MLGDPAPERTGKIHIASEWDGPGHPTAIQTIVHLQPLPTQSPPRAGFFAPAPHSSHISNSRQTQNHTIVLTPQNTFVYIEINAAHNTAHRSQTIQSNTRQSRGRSARQAGGETARITTPPPHARWTKRERRRRTGGQLALAQMTSERSRCERPFFGGAASKTRDRRF